jgi:hypothetical protein
VEPTNTTGALWRCGKTFRAEVRVERRVDEGQYCRPVVQGQKFEFVGEPPDPVSALGVMIFTVPCTLSSEVLEPLCKCHPRCCLGYSQEHEYRCCLLRGFSWATLRRTSGTDTIVIVKLHFRKTPASPIRSSSETAVLYCIF